MSILNAKAVSQVRTRFAPSPTGYLHVGGARTAIFNWLFARSHGGQFLLRIEDTDTERSGEDMVAAIIAGMRWLSLDWDEEIVHQSARLDIYQKHLDELLAAGKAYKCFCSKETLDRKRRSAADKKKDFRYRDERTCYHLSSAEIAGLEAQNAPCAIRLKVPESGETAFEDEVYGRIVVRHTQLDDLIIRRSDGFPTYHFAVVVDDHLMRITHVIRGEDHLSNTPKHVLLYNAFAWSVPTFAHVPLILGPDKRRLSKRHGATAVGQYETSGYMPEALRNFLSLLGWAPGEDREILTLDELVREFSLTGISKKSAVFDERKLEWMNCQYIMQLSLGQLYDLALPRLQEAGFLPDSPSDQERSYVMRILELLQPRLKRLNEVDERSAYFFSEPTQYDEKSVSKLWTKPGVLEQLTRLYSDLASMDEFTIDAIEGVVRRLAEELEVGAGKVIQPLRLALTGGSVSPGIFEVMTLMGQETVLSRIRRAMEYIEKNHLQAV